MNTRFFAMTNKINIYKHFLLVFSVFISFTAFSQEENKSGEHKSEKFNAGELIIDHIIDAHEWHIAGHIAVPLPVILYSQDKGLSMFSSSHLEGGEVYNGFKMVKNHIVAVNGEGTTDEVATSKLWDISITKNVASMFVSILLMFWMFLSTAKAYKNNPGKAPKGMQSLLEPLIIFVRDDIAKSAIGEKK